MTAHTPGGADLAPLAGAGPGLRRRMERAAPFLPGLLMLTLLFVIPMIIMLLFSFWRTNSDFDLVRDWNLNNYARFFNQPTYIRTLAKTLAMASAVTAAGLAISLPFTYFLVRYVSRRLQRAVLLAVIVPFWTSYLLRVYAWQAILGEKGALNQFLMGIGLIKEPTTLLAYNDYSVFLVLVYVYFPFAALALYASLERFD